MFPDEKNAAAVVAVTVVIPCRNEIRFVCEFLDSVFRQELMGIELEIIVADGMSDDGTREILNRYVTKFSALRVIDNRARIVSTGLNTAIREARGEIIVRMDVHTVYAPDYIRRCVEVLNKTNAENVGGPALTRADGFVAQAIAHAFHARFARGGAKFQDLQYEGPVDTVPYGCWRKSTLERFNLFDETLVRSQDYDLNRRIASVGGIVWQSPKIVSWYRPRRNLSSLFRQYFQYGFWKVSVIRKDRRSASVRNLVPGACLLAAMLLPLGVAITNVGGLFVLRDILLYSWATLAALYFAGSFVASLVSAGRTGWKFLPLFPIVFATYHFSYGLGFLLGLSYRPPAWDRPSSIQKILTEITR